MNNWNSTVFYPLSEKIAQHILAAYSFIFLTNLSLNVDQKHPNVHAIWVEVKYTESSLLLSNVYRSPSTSVSFWQDFNISLENALNVSTDIFIVGDINEDQLNHNNRHLRNIQLLNNLKNVIVDPSRVTASSSTLIDPILVPNECNPLHSGVLDIPVSVSDHKATFLYIPFICSCIGSYKRKVWFYKSKF